MKRTGSKSRSIPFSNPAAAAVLTASFGVIGYSLPWDQIGYWAA